MGRKFLEWQRTEIWNRDRGICGICGRKARKNNWEADHIWPWSSGGETTVENGQVSHPWCNRDKSGVVYVTCSFNDEW